MIDPQSRCPACGTQNLMGSRFCDRCAAALAQVVPEQWLAGTDVACEIRLVAPTVSSRHWLPKARILHPWPEQRFAERIRDKSPVR